MYVNEPSGRKLGEAGVELRHAGDTSRLHLRNRRGRQRSAAIRAASTAGLPWRRDWSAGGNAGT